jgi:methionyl-tRNA synthetase
MNDYRFNAAIATLWAVASSLNLRIEEVKPWELAKQDKTDELAAFLDEIISGLRCIAHWLTPFLPETAEKLANMFTADSPVQRGEPLFPRLD